MIRRCNGPRILPIPIAWIAIKTRNYRQLFLNSLWIIAYMFTCLSQGRIEAETTEIRLTTSLFDHLTAVGYL